MTQWTPTIDNCDSYMDERTGKYEYRAVRYRHTADWMLANGLKDGMTVFDVGAGMCEFGFCLMNEYGLKIRYVPVDGGIDGVNLNDWTPPREAHFFVALELLEHLTMWPWLLTRMQGRATIGVAISTPNPSTTDVLGMDATHVTEVHAEQLEGFDMTVTEETFYGGVFSGGKPDSLFGSWLR